MHFYKPVTLFMLALCMLMVPHMGRAAEAENAYTPPESWLIFYDAAKQEEGLMRHGLLVMQPEKHPPIRPLIDRNIQLFGKLTVGSIAMDSPFFRIFQEQGLLAGKDVARANYMRMDITQKKWLKFVVEEWIPYVLHEGFKGIYLDRLSELVRHPSQNKEQVEQARKSVIELIKMIRFQYPHIQLLVNIPVDMIEEVRELTPLIVVEGLYSRMDEKNNIVVETPGDEFKQRMMEIKHVQEIVTAKGEPLYLFSLDYCNKEDKATCRLIYDQQKTSGFIPLVAYSRAYTDIPDFTAGDASSVLTVPALNPHGEERAE